MAYNKDGFQRMAIGGAIAATFPDAGSVKSLYSYVTNDTLGQMLADGYFDGIEGDPLQVGDLILAAYDADGTPGSALLIVTVGGGDVTVVPSAAGGPKEEPATSVNLSNVGVSVIGSTNNTKNWTMDAPAAGVEKTIIGDPASTVNALHVAVGAGVTISSTYGTTHTNIDFTGRGSVTLVGYSATHWKVLSGYGLVAFS